MGKWHPDVLTEESQLVVRLDGGVDDDSLSNDWGCDAWQLSGVYLCDGCLAPEAVLVGTTVVVNALVRTYPVKARIGPARILPVGGKPEIAWDGLRSWFELYSRTFKVPGEGLELTNSLVEKLAIARALPLWSEVEKIG